MKKTTRITAGLATIGLIAGCADRESEPTPTVTVTETVAAEHVSDSEENAAVDDWLQTARERYLFGLDQWFREQYDADCLAYEPDCYEVFAGGLPLLEGYQEYLTDTYDDQPEYVPASHARDVGQAVRAMESWSYACPDDSDCEQRAIEAVSAAFEVITETSDW